MADRHSSPAQPPRAPRPTSSAATSSTTTTTNSFLSKLHEHAPNSTQLVGILTLLISGGILLLLTGVTVTVTIMGLIFFTPLIVVTSPIWVPIGTVVFVAVAGFLSMCGFAVAVLAGLSWLYKYFRGFNPPGSGPVDYARIRIYDTAREYGGYLQSKVKDAAPGA